MTDFDNPFDAADDYWFQQRYADLKFAEEEKRKRSQEWREEASQPAQLTEPATIHAYPYSKTEPITIDELKKSALKKSGLKKYSQEMTPEQVAAWTEDHPEEVRRWDKEMAKPAAPKPSAVHFKPSPEKIKEMAEAFKPVQEGFKRIAASAEKATVGFKKLTPEHLTERPFHTPEMVALRESLAKNQ